MIPKDNGTLQFLFSPKTPRHKPHWFCSCCPKSWIPALPSYFLALQLTYSGWKRCVILQTLKIAIIFRSVLRVIEWKGVVMTRRGNIESSDKTEDQIVIVTVIISNCMEVSEGFPGGRYLDVRRRTIYEALDCCIHKIVDTETSSQVS